jgi:hypothetical protein
LRLSSQLLVMLRRSTPKQQSRELDEGAQLVGGKRLLRTSPELTKNRFFGNRASAVDIVRPLGSFLPCALSIGEAKCLVRSVLDFW